MTEPTYRPTNPLVGSPADAEMPRPLRQWTAGPALTVIAASTLLSMAVWFSATFVTPQLVVEWDLSSGETSLLTIAVQLGFVVGAVVSAMVGIADAVPSRRLMCAGALGAAVCNGGLLLSSGLATALPLRLLTGMFLAAVYPPAIKEVSTWFQSGRGKALGVMVGALTLGSALPHLVNVFGDLDWHLVIAVTSILTALGGLLITVVHGQGSYPFPRRQVSISGAFASLRNRNVALANLGYVGHMWELYAMWAGVGAFLATLPAIAASSNPQALASGLAFLCIGIGAVGCLVGGVLSDRKGRAPAAFICLVLSGGAALILSITYTLLPVFVVVALCVFWGFWVIADSAQFSALVTESADGDYVGSALSLQLALGYLTTVFTLWLVPTLVAATSWHVALAALAIGPAFGAVAMRRVASAST